jgi:hypothetical protein
MIGFWVRWFWVRFLSKPKKSRKHALMPIGNKSLVLPERVAVERVDDHRY